MALELIKEFKLNDEETVYVFQGNIKGDRSPLDIIIKYRDKYTPERSKGRQLSHTSWTVALLMKRQVKKELTLKYVEYLLGIYDKIEGFKSKEEQRKCEIKYADKTDLKQFEELNNYGQFSVQLLTYIMELLSIEEKTDNPNAYMFKGLLKQILETDDIYAIIGSARYSKK